MRFRNLSYRALHGKGIVKGVSCYSNIQVGRSRRYEKPTVWHPKLEPLLTTCWDSWVYLDGGNRRQKTGVVRAERQRRANDKDRVILFKICAVEQLTPTIQPTRKWLQPSPAWTKPLQSVCRTTRAQEHNNPPVLKTCRQRCFVSKWWQKSVSFYTKSTGLHGLKADCGWVYLCITLYTDVVFPYTFIGQLNLFE